MNICVAVVGLSDSHRERLESAMAGHALRFVAGMPETEKRAAVAAAEVMFGNVSAAWLGSAAGLRWVQLDSAGVDAYLGINSVSRVTPVVLTNLCGFFDRAVAEAVLAGVLAIYRQLPRLILGQSEVRWIKTDVEPDIRALDGQRVVVLGAGGIARQLERVLNAFGAHVQFYSRTARPGSLSTPAELDAALGTTELLINTLPHTPATIGLLNRERLARLKYGAVVVNAGRGSALDESALVELIDRGQLGGAVLDVTATEPLPPASLLWRHPKVLLTQHTGGRFPGELDRKLDVFVANFARFERGEPMQCRVDTERGY